jgi:hypothetical protein
MNLRAHVNWLQKAVDELYAKLAVLAAQVIFGKANGFVSVKTFGAVGNGAADDTAAIARGLAAVAGTGIALWFPGGTYRVTSQIDLPSFVVIWGSPSATIHQVLTGAANTSAFAGQPVFGASVALTADNVAGTNVIQTGTRFPNGTRIFVGDQPTPGPSAQASTYTVMSSSAAGPDWNLVVDRIVLGSYSAATGSITPLVSYPQEIYIWGNGMLFTGTSGGALTGYIGFGAAFHCYVFDVRADPSLGTLSANGKAFNYDLGSVECGFFRCRADCGGVATVAGFSFQGSENVLGVDCIAINCGNGFELVDGFLCVYEQPSGGNNTNDLAFLSNNGASAVGVTGAIIRGADFSGSSNGVNLAYGSSDIQFDSCQFYSCIITAFWVQNNNGPCAGITIEDIKIIGGCTTAGMFISGDGHQIEASGPTIDFVSGNGIEVTGNACRIMVDGLSSYDAATNGSSGVLLVNGTSDLIVKRAYTALTFSIASWFVVVPQGGATISVDDLLVEQSIGVASISVVFQVNAICNLRLRNVRTIGPVDFGINAGAFVGTMRILEGCNFHSCSTPISINAAVHYNRPTVTAAGTGAAQAYAFPDLAEQERVYYTRVVNGGVPTSAGPLYVYTAGVGYTRTYAAADTSTYNEVIL